MMPTKKENQELVESIIESYHAHPVISKIGSEYSLNRTVIVEIVTKLREIIFPGYFGKQNLRSSTIEYHVGELLADIRFLLQEQLEKALRYDKVTALSFESGNSRRAEGIVDSFLRQIPVIREVLETDVQAAFAGDPAAFSTEEIIFSYPGLFAVTVNRIAHELYLLKAPLIPRIMTEYAHGLTGIDIHPGATIGRYFFIDHGTGVVIGETTVIGNNVKIYQGVTLGALSTRGGQALRSVKRHPTLEDNVTVYSGASILGGDTVIGKGVVVGSNVFVTKSVPDRTRVSVKNPELQFKDQAPSEFKQEGFFDWVI